MLVRCRPESPWHTAQPPAAAEVTQGFSLSSACIGPPRFSNTAQSESSAVFVNNSITLLPSHANATSAPLSARRRQALSRSCHPRLPQNALAEMPPPRRHHTSPGRPADQLKDRTLCAVSDHEQPLRPGAECSHSLVADTINEIGRVGAERPPPLPGRREPGPERVGVKVRPGGADLAGRLSLVSFCR